MTKKNLLELLERNRGQSISGEFIAGQLGISRAAVWKAVKELEKEGYVITAATKRGYCLSGENDILSAQGILPFLRDAGETERGRKIIVEPSLESTNITAKQLAISGAEHGTVVLADHQTAGRGRYGRSFFSPKGCSVYMSLILRPQEIWLDVPTLVTAFSAVAVCDAIKTVCEKETQIKWVNDIFFDGKKICGISTEAVADYESGTISWIVVGIGVNFITPQEGVPQELQNVIGTIFAAAEKPTATRNRLAAEIINNMAALDTAQRAQENFLKKYRERLLFIGEEIIVSGTHGAGKDFTATATDIDETGRLIVRTENGEVLSLSSGEVRVRKVES
ncbi:MAG: biotin--[acetyl-CoA-carboxylase] ligase [Defluviitaleaceae bacterium]|nr:biotin--[acetyl-CoA-carboxylase] ligase [Defluviitaleaceae bacterium]MCL2262251.1 biotin--[acetyl-CoA-carboxylase] ligase [Defluviitaleaceae bacterium]